VRLSLLDRSRTRADRPDAEGLTGSLARAVHAEDLGYQRFWVAEHHAVPGIASGSPPVLLAAIGAATSRIRLGSGGVMLPNHQPLVVAEQFLMLEALYPGRVDLGLGRSLGFTAPVRQALREDEAAPDTFEDDLRELASYLHRRAAVTARPQVPGQVPMHLLATGRGLATAARLGLPVVVGGPILTDASLRGALDGYRKDFRPSAQASRPSVSISLDVLVADSDAEARELALPESWAMARARQTGEFPPLESVRAIRRQPWSDQVRSRVEQALDRSVAGSPATIRQRIERLVDDTAADEIMVSSSTHDRDALFASDAELYRIVRG
jgi:luciferase family oxidoreductase group 1